MGIGLLFNFFSLLNASTTYNVLMSQVVSQMNVTTTALLCNYSKVCQIIQKINSSEIDVCNVLIQPTSYQENLPQCANSSSYCVASYSYSYSAEGGPFPSLYWIAIPQALNGLAHMLVFLSALEFILAQCKAFSLVCGMPCRVSIWGSLWLAMCHVLCSTGSTMLQRLCWCCSFFAVCCSCSQVQVSPCS